jgi:lipoate-protein ligase A
MIRLHLPSSPLGEEAGFAARGGSAPLFAALDIYDDADSRSAALNMAIDEALLEAATVTTIRFYRWDHPALSFGYFGKFQDVANYERDRVRRWTGGGIVFHGRDLTYSIVIPASEAAFGESSMSIYEKTHDAIRAALAACGQAAELATVAALYERRPTVDSAVTDRRYNKNSCFANPVRADVVCNGQKVAGAAQRRTRRGLIQQGSIQNVDLGNDFSDLFARTLCGACCQQKLDNALVARAEDIARRKYGTDAWLHKR